MLNTRWWACCAVVLVACVKPGELDNKEEFERLLLGDGGLLDGGARPGSGGRGGASGGGGASGASGGTNAPAQGCAEACEIIETRCATAGCHSAMNPQGMLDLASPNIATRLKDKAGTTAGCTTEKLYVEGKPEESIIYGKLLNPPACGTIRMPVGLPLKDDEIACVLRWLANPVCGGAPNAGSGGARAGSGGMAGTRAGAGGMAGTRAGAGGMNPMPSGSTIWLEAEDANMITPPLEIADDAEASGDKLVRVPTQVPDIRMTEPEGTDGIATYTFEVTETDMYRFWGRVRLPDAEGNSFWVQVDGGDWYNWNNIETVAMLPLGEFVWDDFHDADNSNMVVEVELDEGEHTLRIANREDHAEIDKILVTNDTNLTPMGEGE